MLALTGAPFTCSPPNLSLKPIRAVASKPFTSSLSSSLHPPRLLSPFVPEVEEAVASLHSEFRDVDNLVAHSTSCVLKAFQIARVGSHFFAGCTGYGRDEAGGREGLDQAFADIFGAESAIVRSQFFSGTHAITCALFAILRPGDEVIFVNGTFIDGSTSELSCDGPLREPFAIFCQGGTHWTQWGLVLGEVLKSI